jgi:hypothetical protein
MTLEDIEGVFNKAAFGGECQFGGLDHRAGIRAVVQALRDDATSRANTNMWDGRDFEDFFDEILASDGVKSEGSE